MKKAIHGTAGKGLAHSRSSENSNATPCELRFYVQVIDRTDFARKFLLSSRKDGISAMKKTSWVATTPTAEGGGRSG